MVQINGHGRFHLGVRMDQYPLPELVNQNPSSDRRHVPPAPKLDRWLGFFKVDFAPDHRQPSWSRVALATVISVAGSLLADTLLVVIAQAVFPGTKGYIHFEFHDYARLTVIGVFIACVAWPIVTRMSSAPRWLFFRQAVAVTFVLWLPDLYILHKGQPAEAVAFLMLMHLAIALVTYNSLVHIAPAGLSATQGGRGREPQGSSDTVHSC